LPDARTSHLRTLSKIVGIGLSASSPYHFPVAAEASEGAAHYRVVFVAVNTLFRFFTSFATRAGFAEEVLHSGGFRLVRQHPISCFDHLRFGAFRLPLRGPRIIGELPNPSTPQRVFCFLRRAFLRTSLRGPRIIGWLRNPSTPCAFFFSFAPRSCERRCEGRGLCMAATPLGRP
jgi:hypothetical protein